MPKVVDAPFPRLCFALDRFSVAHSPFSRGHFLGTRILRYAVRRGALPPPLVRGEEGVLLECVPEVAMETVVREVALHGGYEPETVARLRRATPRGGVFVDVGANLGYLSTLASRWVGPQGRVYAFEPGARIHRLLRRTLELNGAANVEAFPFACAAETGRGRMVDYGDSALSHLETHGEGEGGAEGEEVRITTLDDFAASHSLSRLDVLKVDTEGADFEVLKGARETLMRFRPVIVMEAHHLHRFGASVEGVRAFLEPLGYAIEEMRNKHSVDLVCTPARPA